MRIFLILVLWFSFPVEARWADPSEADAATNIQKLHYRVHKDATYTLDVEIQQEILKEGARQRLGLTRINYDARASKFELLEAYTLNDGKKIKVRPEYIEIKPMASSGPGFDEVNQVTIAFPEVNVGSKLYYRYRRDVKKPQVPDMFWLHFPLGWSELLQHFEMTVESEIPLYFESFDPEKKLEVTELHEKRIGVKLKEPLFRQILEEDNAKMDSKSLVWLAVSSLKEWSGLPKDLVNGYEKVANSPLPAKYKEIVELAKKQSNVIAQINTVTSKLADTVRYVGDWVPVEGAFFPRPLQTVVETGFGDCKDFSSDTVAMLRQMGFKAHVAWVVRERNLVESPITLATPHFNHAIVFASKDGEDYWLDPTNISSWAQGLYEDIAFRNALVLDPAEIKLRRIPAASEKDALTDVVAKVNFKSGKKAVTTGKAHLEGGDMVGMTASGLSYAKSTLDYAFLGWLATPASVTSWKFSDYDLRSRIVSDLDLHFEFSENWLTVLTSAGPGYMTRPIPHLDNFQFRRDQRISSLYLGLPHVMHRRLEFDGAKAQLDGKVVCQGKSPWLEYSRQFLRSGKGVVLDEKIVLKKSTVSIDEIQSKAFADFQTSLRACQHPAVLVLRR